VLYPPHTRIKLESKNDELMLKLAAENAKLRDLASRHTSDAFKGDLTHFVFSSGSIGTSGQLQCSLCGMGFLNLQCLRLHLHSRMHRDRERDLPAVHSTKF
jgi:hypothetical protein